MNDGNETAANLHSVWNDIDEKENPENTSCFQNDLWITFDFTSLQSNVNFCQDILGKQICFS